MEAHHTLCSLAEIEFVILSIFDLSRGKAFFQALIRKRLLQGQSNLQYMNEVFAPLLQGPYTLEFRLYPDDYLIAVIWIFLDR